ncbi:MAG: Holliday junction branch migration protein RuvA [Actinobacteria bacterium]|nr:Holliday junction branch migration protein RuvA [Actinomycetota bacterium]MCL5447469.1 Holliday junction branch migration protein RuvA [Actinomycetota bacterium]
MIGWLCGKIRLIDPDGSVLIDVGGVGYRVNVTPASLGSICRGADVELYIHTHVREDAITLYGFASDSERMVFEMLIGAHGVGPTLGMSIMSSLGVRDLYEVVVDENMDLLCTVPGIGRKTAAKLAIDLKSGADVLAAAAGSVAGCCARDPNMDGNRVHEGMAAADAAGGGDDLVEGSIAGGNFTMPPDGTRAGYAQATGVAAGNVRAGEAGAHPVSPDRDSLSKARSEVRAALKSLGYTPEEIRLAMRHLGGMSTVEEMVRGALRAMTGGRAGGDAEAGADGYRRLPGGGFAGDSVEESATG